MNIRIARFQAFGDTEFVAEGFTVLVGPSNVGKSAAVRALVGALFNRPGEAFVRQGSTVANVHLTALPTSTPGRTVTVDWAKGHNTNEFTVDGTRYTKVGLGAPEALQDAGYRDIWIGDRDRQRGQYIRPQVADQFDGLFLLSPETTGSFVSDVLSVVSRLAVLLRAHQRAASDLKSQKQLLGVRRKDWDAAVAKLATLAPVEALSGRVDAMGAPVAALEQDARLVEGLRACAVQRAVVAPVARRRLPARTPVPVGVGDACSQVRGLVDLRGPLVRAVGRKLPQPTPVTALGEAVKAETIRGFVIERRRYLPLQASVLSVEKTYPLQKIGQVVAKIDRLRELAGERTQAMRAHFDAVRALKSVRDEGEETRATLTLLLAELDVCPLCDRPMQGT